MNKIIVYTNPTAPFQKIIAFENGVIIDQLGVTVEDLPGVLQGYAKKYNITDVEFLGAREYSLGLMHQVLADTKFSQGLNIKYYGG